MSLTKSGPTVKVVNRERVSQQVLVDPDSILVLPNIVLRVVPGLCSQNVDDIESVKGGTHTRTN